MSTEDIMNLVCEYGSALQSSSFAYECGDLGGSKRHDAEADELRAQIESAITELDRALKIADGKLFRLLHERTSPRNR